MAWRIRALQTTLRSRVERREALIDLLNAVNTTLEPEGISALILDRAATWVPAPCWALVCTDPSGRLSVLAARGLPPDAEPPMQNVARWVITEGELFLSADLQHDARVNDGLSGTVLALPLTCRGRQVGAVIGLDPRPSARPPALGASLVGALGALLGPAAVALDNALLLRRTEALSVTDDLTRLYNSRYLNLVLHRESKRATRNGRPLSLLFIDLDGFKTINDTHGHLSGSRALVEAAVVIRGCARETDIVARFGGDEFAVVLPDTSDQGAVAVGERVRQRLADHRFLAGDGLSLRLTASVGVATMPDAATSAEELVRAADGAMYRVKDRGKNGIELAAARADGP